ncbi:MAG: DUF4846 domain-containing protein [Bacteroidota bacterium]
MKLSLLIALLIVCSGCFNGERSDTVQSVALVNRISETYPDESGNTVESRYKPPTGFERIESEESSFAEYLRNLPLKDVGSTVRYFNGSTKENRNVYSGVVDLEIGDRDLHQCADAIMRLRAEYLWKQKRFDEIHFNFTNGFRVDYAKWMEGNRVVVERNKTFWRNSAAPANDYDTFWKYLEIIFSYAGTLSLSEELNSVPAEKMEIGDVFIQGGSPGHAVIVVDMAVNEDKGQKMFMLAQSYMPAQEIQILVNPNDRSSGSWYSLDFGETLITPEWTFQKGDLKRF